MTIAVIPARGGSKRIPGKNIKPFLGVPIMARVIDTLQKAGFFNRIIVSTDDAGIADTARAAGAETPFMRPGSISDDNSSSLAVMSHAIEALEAAGTDCDIYCLVYATAVFMTAADVKAGYSTLMDTDADYCFPVVDFDYPIQRAVELRGGKIHMVCPEHHLTRSQDLPPRYHDAGQYYWGRRDAFLTGASPFAGNAVAQPLPRYRIVDIDTDDDWQRAELIFAALQQQEIP